MAIEKGGLMKEKTRWNQIRPKKRKKRKKGTILLLVLLIIFVITLSIIQKSKPPEPEPEYKVTEGIIQQGDTLYGSLESRGLSPGQILHLSATLKPVFDPKRCRVGDRYELTRTIEGKLKAFKYYTSPIDYYTVYENESGELTAEKQTIPLKKELLGAEGKIKTNLYEAMVSQEIPAGLTMDFADIFAWEIDFLTEPRRGDTFRFIYESYQNNGEIIKQGRILTAQYNGRSGNHTAIYFENKEGRKDYYDLKANSLKRAFLRSPLNYRRISSYFSHRRFHPILKRYRPHLGIDYTASTGTPVVTIGDGVVIYRGWKGGYGRFVKIRHPNNYYTTYGHLSRYGREIKRGIRVKQGQVIGHVGSTGLSTGPHLDFRMIKDGRFINFLRLKIPAAKRLNPKYKDEFDRLKRERLMQLASLSQQRSEVGNQKPVIGYQ